MKQRLKKMLLVMLKPLALLNAFEGVVHLVVAVVGAWGIFAIGAHDWRVWLPVVENFVFGVFSIITGILLKKGHDWAKEFHHHH